MYCFGKNIHTLTVNNNEIKGINVDGLLSIFMVYNTKSKGQLTVDSSAVTAVTSAAH